ncbi:MAG: CDP-diacylglycerol--serine O-phosphatidyltransferase [Bacteroidota bacterium]|nr:CDP-diacylglycerol--serine O-phosphatidyltransferase [Bacteroidota bacterium]
MQFKKNIPNAITSLNLISGCVGILFALRGFTELAAMMIVAAALFDFLDGMAARLLHVSSTIGKELDSLSDLVSFGVLPGALVFVMLELRAPVWFYYFALLIPVFSAIRLAKFNLDTRQSESFLGLPVPANALFWVGITYINLMAGETHMNLILKSIVGQPLIIIMLTVFLSLLLVSELPLFSLKFKNLEWGKNQIRYIFLGLAMILLIWLGVSSLPMIIVLYVLLSIFANLKTFKHAD